HHALSAQIHFTCSRLPAVATCKLALLIRAPRCSTTTRQHLGPLRALQPYCRAPYTPLWGLQHLRLMAHNTYNACHNGNSFCLLERCRCCCCVVATLVGASTGTRAQLWRPFLSWQLPKMRSDRAGVVVLFSSHTVHLV